MGLLAEGKSRSRINKDPNNTKWTRDTNSFGQKILRSQGWSPGQFLGVTNAPHSELHTAANASYIRVALKDDMKGLGFSRSKEDEVTGLDVFQDLLSRLNGKTEVAVEEDRQVRLAVKANYYVEQRWGPMRFVRGGLLVGDELREAPKEEDESEASPSEVEAKKEVDDVEVGLNSAPKEFKKEKKSKKRKASDDGDVDTSGRESESKNKKRRKEERKLREAKNNTDDVKAKKEKKDKKDKSRSKKSSEKASSEGSQDEDNSSDQRSKKRKAKKEKKEKQKRKKEEANTSDSASLATTQESTPAGGSEPATGTTTPSGTGTSTPRGSRNFVRSRFIAQKRQAMMDTTALNQIFMVKA
ncbi:telomerase inhibitor [Neonectria magnoliae]|uniref:PinX1-related protein 1 n=1 Tax=Neonectria magnoliae TaxID=2732573 RepID=A0ABR1IDH1_9HYPO